MGGAGAIQLILFFRQHPAEGYQTTRASESFEVNWLSVGNKWLEIKMHINSLYDCFLPQLLLMTAENKFKNSFPNMSWWREEKRQRKWCRRGNKEWIESALVRLIYISRKDNVEKPNDYWFAISYWHELFILSHTQETLPLSQQALETSLQSSSEIFVSSNPTVQFDRIFIFLHFVFAAEAKFLWIQPIWRSVTMVAVKCGTKQTRRQQQPFSHQTSAAFKAPQSAGSIPDPLWVYIRKPAISCLSGSKG